MKVLFLSEWYPHRYDSMAGLFVRKHAEAVARQGVEVCVLYFHKDDKIDKIETIEQSTNNVKEFYVYYPKSFLSALVVGKKWLFSAFGKPDICQVNVISKNGIFAEYLYRCHKIPYVIVEHWSGYLPQNYSLKKGLHLWLMRQIAKDAKCIMPVSQMLENAMKANGFENENYQRIHNVVDDFFYSKTDKNSAVKNDSKKEKIEILHVSCFDEKAKNIKGLLRAVKELSSSCDSFHLNLVGIGQDFDEVQAFSQSLNFPAGMVTFTGEVTPHEVCDYMHKSDFFVLFSNYENAPVVLSECMAIGLPILSSNAGGIPEMMNEKVGILTPVADEKALTANLKHMLEHYKDYSVAEIKANGNLYSYDEVGKMLTEIYRQIC